MLSDGKVRAMDHPSTTVTMPIVTSGPTLWFSAYAFGWGYCAFSLTSEVICEQLGAADGTSRQLLLAFELGKRRVLHAVERIKLPQTGERIPLSAKDLAQPGVREVETTTAA